MAGRHFLGNSLAQALLNKPAFCGGQWHMTSLKTGIMTKNCFYNGNNGKQNFTRQSFFTSLPIMAQSMFF
jgi:hypothetical protein